MLGVRLDEELERRLAAVARSQGRSKSDIAREAVRAVIAQVFGEGTRRIFADIDPEAVASARLLERIGFTCEGRLREEWETHIGVRDTLIYAMLRREWRA